MYQRFLKDKWFGKTLFYPEWVEDAINNSEKILEYYNKAEGFNTIKPGNGDDWKVIVDYLYSIKSYIPKIDKWLKSKKVDIGFWTINSPNRPSPELDTDDILNLKRFGFDKSLLASFGIHTDLPIHAEHLEKWDRSEKSDVDFFNMVSLNIPLLKEDGVDSIEVYSYGTPSAKIKYHKDYFPNFKVPHGFFHRNDLKLGFKENQANKLPVLINVCQPHKFIHKPYYQSKRLLLRLRIENTYREDPWHLFN
jgi:hypothetical protein